MRNPLLCLVAALILCCAGAALAAEDTSEKEIKIGQKSAEQIEKRWPRIMDPKVDARTAMILDKMTPLLQRNLPYEIRQVEMKYPNAFALPGGICYVTTGLMDFVKCDSELAAIIAHELVHADKRHGIIQAARNERMALMAMLGSIAAGLAAKNPGAAVMANMIGVAVMNSYSRDLEREADSGASDIMVRAGYDPSGMLTVFERMSEEELKMPWFDPGVYQSHPDMKERLEFIEDYMKKIGVIPARKHVLGFLVVSISSDDQKIDINVDSTPLVSYPRSHDSTVLAYRIKKDLDSYFQMETPQYNIQIASDELRIGGHTVMRSSELPLHGDFTLTSFRDSLIQSLRVAQSKHPMGRYLNY